MNDLTYEGLSPSLFSGYLQFTLTPRRFRGFRLHLGEEVIMDEKGDSHVFDLIWFKDTEELVAAEVEEALGVILPFNFKLKKNTDRYLFLGNFTEKGIDDLLVHKGKIIRYLRELHVEGSVT